MKQPYEWDTNHTGNIQTLSFSFLSKILVDCLFYLKYKLQGNFHELPHWIFQLLSKQCASELNLLAQNSCSSGVHNNVNFEQHGEAKISHECDPCVFKVLKEYSVICWPCCLQMIFGTYTMVTCLRASTKVCNLCGRYLSQDFSKWCHTQDLKMLLFALRFDVCHVMMFWQVLPEVIYFGQASSYRVGWWCECETEFVWMVIVDKLCSWSLQKRNMLYIVILFRKPVSSSQCAKSSIRSSMRPRSALSHIPIEFFRALQI